jgi:hypothetical protein
MIFADLETHPIERARLAPRIVCAQYAIDDGPTEIRLRDDVPWSDLLEGTIVGANFAYDMACICAMNPELIPAVFRAYDEGRVVDVQLDGKLLDIAAGEYEWRSVRGWNLQELARRAGVRIDKDTDDETGDGSWRLRFAALDGIPVAHWPAGAVRYATAEIPATRAVYRAQQEARGKWQAHGLDPLGVHSAHAAASAFALHLASVQGVLTDPRAVEIVSGRVEAYLAGLARRLQRAGLVRANGSRDTKAAAAAMERACAKVGREIVRTPTGKVQLDRDCAILSGSRVMELYAEYSGAALLRGRVNRMREGYVLPLQTRFDPLKETARTSSTQPSAPLVGEQMQNFPKASGITPAERKAERGGAYFVGLRECFRPPPGFVFIIADFSMAELHTLSQICIRLFGRSVMAEMLNAGKDLHIHFAMSSLGRAYESYSKKTDKIERDRAKPANFGYPGGMGPDKFILYSRKCGSRGRRPSSASAHGWRPTPRCRCISTGSRGSSGTATRSPTCTRSHTSCAAGAITPPARITGSSTSARTARRLRCTRSRARASTRGRRCSDAVRGISYMMRS